ncbi:MAG: hypothetical protein AB7F89_20865 [Pirellulaceae bacterium]
MKWFARKYVLAVWMLLAVLASSGFQASVCADDVCPLCRWNACGMSLLTPWPVVAQLFHWQSPNDAQPDDGLERIGLDFEGEPGPFDLTGAFGTASPRSRICPQASGAGNVGLFVAMGDCPCAKSCQSCAATGCAAPSCAEGKTLAGTCPSSRCADMGVLACETLAAPCKETSPASNSAATCEIDRCEEIAAGRLAAPCTQAVAAPSCGEACAEGPAGICCLAATSAGKSATTDDQPTCGPACHAGLHQENAALRVMLEAHEELINLRTETMEEIMSLVVDKMVAEAKLTIAEKLMAERESAQRELAELKADNMRLQVMAEAAEARHASEKAQMELALENEQLKSRVAELEQQSAAHLTATRTAKKQGGRKIR